MIWITIGTSQTIIVRAALVHINITGRYSGQNSNRLVEHTHFAHFPAKKNTRGTYFVSWTWAAHYNVHIRDYGNRIVLRMTICGSGFLRWEAPRFRVTRTSLSYLFERNNSRWWEYIIGIWYGFEWTKKWLVHIGLLNFSHLCKGTYTYIYIQYIIWSYIYLLLQYKPIYKSEQKLYG